MAARLPVVSAPTTVDLDLLVLGSGVAGLSAAVRAADHHMRVGVLTKGELPQATTRWAQGGVAAVLHDDPDSTDLHLADTLSCGAGLCDTEAVRVLVDEGPSRVLDLIALGAAFDRDPDGTLQLAREGGHSEARIVHAGGAATGAEVERALVVAVQRRADALYEHHFAVDLVLEGGRCRGVTAIAPDGTPVEVRAANVLVTTGGAGQLFAVTTNPLEATGDGIAMALRAGVAVADVEFVQFHPTALHHEAMPRPLLSEALRGHGAMLRDARGERFVDELQPRDVVSRAELEVMVDQGIDHVLLDAPELERLRRALPDHRHRPAGRRPRPGPRPAAGGPGGPLHLRRDRDRPRRGLVACRGCGPPARPRAPVSTGPTGWRRTRCWRAWSSVPVRSSRSSGARSAPRPPAPCGPCWAATSTAVRSVPAPSAAGCWPGPSR